MSNNQDTTQLTQARPWDLSTETYETGHAFAAFRRYLALEPPRTYPPDVHRSWPAKHNWKARALAWDAHVARESESAYIDIERQRVIKAAQAADSLRDAGSDILFVIAKLANLQRKKVEGMSDISDIEKVRLALSAKDAIAAITEGIKLTQLLGGKPTEISASAVLLKKKVDELTEDELIQLLSETRLAKQLSNNDTMQHVIDADSYEVVTRNEPEKPNEIKDLPGDRGDPCDAARRVAGEP